MQTLLVVDDEPNLLYSLQTSLQCNELMVVTASTAKEGINLVAESAPDAVLLDVRLESEHKNSAIKGSRNLPIYMLRLKADGLDSGKKYVCYCDTGRRSSAAAYLLSERGLDAYVLKGGLTSLPQAKQ